MRENLAGALWRLAVYATVCLLSVALVFVVFAQLRFQAEKTYNAVFTNVSGLRNGDFVRIAGVEVGKVKKTKIQPDSTVQVEFSAAPAVVLTEGTRAAVRYDDLIGGRFLALEEGTGGVRPLEAGATIPPSQTEPALDLDALIGGFRPLFRALDPDQVNALSAQLIVAFQGQGATISSFLAQTASLTNTLGERDQLIGQVIDNLNTVLGSFGGQTKQFAKAVDSLSELVDGLSASRQDVSNAVAYGNAAAASIADLLAQGRRPFKKLVTETNRTAEMLEADHDHLDNLLNTLPDKYQMLARLGIYGDFFTFYLCDAILKLNGKGGQPVYVKVAGQDTGRCAPK